MGFRFRKSVKIIPGVRLNFSKSGISTSIGGRGATVNISKRGTRTTVGIPGTGVSYSNYKGKTSSARSTKMNYSNSATTSYVAPTLQLTAAQKRHGNILLLGTVLFVVGSFALMAGALWGLVSVCVGLGFVVWASINERKERKRLEAVAVAELKAKLQNEEEDRVKRELARIRAEEEERVKREEERVNRELAKLRAEEVKKMAELKAAAYLQAEYDKRVVLMDERIEQGLLSQGNKNTLMPYILNKTMPLQKLDSKLEELRIWYVRVNALVEKYGEEIARKLVKEEFWIGMTREQVIESKNCEPDKTEIEALKTKTKEILIYGNKSSGDIFVIENGIVARFKDR